MSHRACPSILTRVVHALINLHITQLSSEANCTYTLKPRTTDNIMTCTSIGTGRRHTEILFSLTVVSKESFWTSTHVAYQTRLLNRVAGIRDGARSGRDTVGAVSTILAGWCWATALIYVVTTCVSSPTDCTGTSETTHCVLHVCVFVFVCGTCVCVCGMCLLVSIVETKSKLADLHAFQSVDVFLLCILNHILLFMVYFFKYET